MELSKSSIRIFLSRAGSAIIQFVGIVVFSRAFGASDIGVFFLFQATLAILAFPADFGVMRAVEKRISENQQEVPSLVASGAILKIVILLPVSVAIHFNSDWINQYIGADVAHLLIIALVVQESGRFLIHVLKGNFRVGETAIFELGKYSIWLVLGVVVVRVGLGVRALIVSLILGLSFVPLLAYPRIDTGLGTPSVEHVKSLYRFIKYNFVSQIGGQFYSWMDVAIIGLLLTQADVAAYEVAWKITGFVTLLSAAIATTIFPQVSEWSSKGENNNIQQMLHDFSVPALYFVIPSFFGSIILAEDILRIVFGTEFSVAWTVFIILMFEKIFHSLHMLFGRSLIAINKPDLSARATLFAVTVNLLLNFALIPHFGIMGAAIATTTSFLLEFVINLVYLSRYINISLPFAEIMVLTISGALMTASLSGINTYVQVNDYVALGLMILTGAVIYISTSFASTSVRDTMVRFTRNAL